MKAKRSEAKYIILLALLLGSQPVATDLYLPALPAIAAELGNPALTLTGLMLAFGSILIPVLRVFAVKKWAPPAGRAHSAVPLAVIALMAIADAVFNSFFFYPAIIAAGALATPCGMRRGKVTSISSR